MTLDWRRIQLQNFTSLEKLARYLDLKEDLIAEILKKPNFPLNLPLRLAEKVQKGTLEDPILKQFLPSIEEEKISPLFIADPVQDILFQKNKSRLLQKYKGRALLITTSACAMHCRYCFRKNFDYEFKEQNFCREIDLIKQDSSLKEILLSGGDPLSLRDETLKTLLEDLSKIPHLKRIRFHTRFPIGIPERINDSFLNILSSVEKQIIFVIHANHPLELDTDIFSAMKSIQKLGIPVLSQTVLLKAVNDDAETLESLFEKLSDHGILPYYLHQLDRVKGSEHFEVPRETGKEIMRELASRLSGYSLPKYVQEIPGNPSKTLISFL